MGTHNHADGLKKPLLRLWAGLCLGGMLLGLALAPASVPQVASASPQDFDCGEVTEIPQAECEALVALYESTDGPNWRYQGDWLQSNTPCGWNGVSCEAGRVIGIDLGIGCPPNDNCTFIGLSGDIPPEIGHLPHLETLDLSYSQLTFLPAEIGQLSNLTSLNISYSSLSSLPPEIGNLTNLQEVDLSGNQLTSLPATFGNLTSLQVLNFYGNLLTSLPHEFWNLSNLNDLDLSFNRFSSLPAEFGNLNKLNSAALNYNQLSNLPREIASLSNLETLFLESNQIRYLPPEIGQLSNLQWLFLADNQLTGLPPEIGNLSKLKYLRLDNNQLSSLPPEFGNLSNLDDLDLNHNQLSSLPAEFGNLSSLTLLYLYNNQLTHLPPEFGNLTNLYSLGLANNQISGLPAEFGNLSNLFWLDLDSNQLSNLPPEFGNLSNLFWLDLDNNQLSNLPPEFGNLSNLERVDLFSNQLTSLPPEFGDLTDLSWLQLRNNQLSSLPKEIGHLTRLDHLDLSFNLLTNLPSEITNLKFVENAQNSIYYSFNISYNRLAISNPVLLDYLDIVEPDWADTQTVPPLDLHLHNAAPHSLALAWTPIRFTDGPGYYELSLAENPAGPYTVLGTTEEKTGSAYTADLSTQPAYYLRMRTFSATDEDLFGILPELDVWSEYSPPLAILTEPVSPAAPASLIYIDEQNQVTQVDVPANTVTSPGTLYLSSPAAVRLERNFTFNGQSFTLGLYQEGAYSDELQLSTPLTLTLTYQQDSLVDEHLQLVYWDPVTRGWREAAQTCSPPGAVEHSPEAHQMVVPVCRLGSYALVSAQPIQYLPAIRQSR